MICDLAETYGILDYRRVPARLLGTLLIGLRDDSRIMQAYMGTKGSAEMIMLAACLDALKVLLWQRTEDGMKGRNAPKQLAPYYAGTEKPQEKRKDIKTFSSLEEYYRARDEVLKG